MQENYVVFMWTYKINKLKQLTTFYFGLFLIDYLSGVRKKMNWLTHIIIFSYLQYNQSILIIQQPHPQWPKSSEVLVDVNLHLMKWFWESYVTNLFGELK